jgi:hypothetical protein
MMRDWLELIFCSAASRESSLKTTNFEKFFSMSMDSPHSCGFRVTTHRDISGAARAACQLR